MRSPVVRLGPLRAALIGAAAHASGCGCLDRWRAGAGTGAAIGNNQDRIDQRQATNAAISQAQAQAQARMIQPVDVVKMTKERIG